MRAFGARGYVSPEQLKRSNAIIAAAHKARRNRERAEIAALSNKDIQKIMARVIIACATARTAVTERDMVQAGVPPHRIEKNRDAAMRQARIQEPRLDAMLSQPSAA